MTSFQPEGKCCGTCKWWDHYPRTKSASRRYCFAPIPSSIAEEWSIKMLWSRGADCPVWEKELVWEKKDD